MNKEEVCEESVACIVACGGLCPGDWYTWFFAFGNAAQML